MKKKIKKESGPDRIQRAQEEARKAKVIRDLCDRIIWLFDMPANQGMDGSEIEISNLIEKISPWQSKVSNDDAIWEALWQSYKVAFGFGYALGQMLDLPDIDITPIKELLKEKRGVLYMPHEKKAA